MRNAGPNIPSLTRNTPITCTHIQQQSSSPPPLYPHFKKREREKKMVGGGRKRNKRDERRKCSSTSLPCGYITRALWNNFISRLLSQFSSENYYHSCSSLYLYPLFWRLFRCIPFSFQPDQLYNYLNCRYVAIFFVLVGFKRITVLERG